MLGDPAFGFARNGAPVITNNFAFRDSSLVPLRGEEPESTEQTREVSHDHA
ncbi:hypothetical protein BURCENBC7_AP5870 [Burkholderia cenocepacia BC7]|nr:hypothetical protein BURCENK562V_C5933 [Burkholderia cenocepacia K56-2Valvano]ERI31685.1 hypothetical protein BURCENBC7_AP5870 [Burkholderia cenocepacia BC7]